MRDEARLNARPLWPPPLLEQRTWLARVAFAAILPAAFGALCGWSLGTSAVAYHVMTTAGGVGGVMAGFEHVGWRSGLLRGALGGVLFATALLVAHTIDGSLAVATLPLAIHPMLVFYALTSMPLGALGGWLRARRERARR